MHQRFGLGDVGDLGGRADQRVNHPGHRIDTDVRLHAEEPLISLLGLAHFRVALLRFVLRRRRRIDDRGVNDGSFAQHQTALGQQRIYLREDLLGQLVAFQQVTKVQDRRLIGNRIVAKLALGKSAHRVHVVQRFFHRRIRQAEPLLQAVDAQHRFQGNRRPSAFRSSLRIEGLDHSDQPIPGHDLVHLREKALALGRLLLGQVFRRRETHLIHLAGSAIEVAI